MNDIALLDSRMQPGIIKYQKRCLEEGIPTFISETRRLPTVQMAYYSRGRSPVSLVKEYFKFCKLWAISDADALKRNTETLYSKHLDGLAADVAPMKDGKAWWDASPDIWNKMCRIAEDECGLDFCAAGKLNAWGWDLAHVEFVREI
jgi:peptidoglycan LD-endopeptidase CwlK